MSARASIPRESARRSLPLQRVPSPLQLASFMYGLATFQADAFALGSGANEYTYESFKSKDSLFLISLWFSWM